jgi:hypothetical protein
MGEGMGTFIKIENPIQILSSYIISFGDSHMIAQADRNDLKIKFIEGPKADFK